MSKRRITNIRDEQGSSLISTLLLLVFLIFLMTSATTVIRHQMLQYRQTAHSYEAKTLIEMTETILLSEENTKQLKVVEFNKGRVSVERLSENTYLLQATLTNQYTSKKRIELTPEDDETKHHEIERTERNRGEILIE